MGVGGGGRRTGPQDRDTHGSVLSRMAHTRRTPWAAMAALCIAMAIPAHAYATTTKDTAGARAKAEAKAAARKAKARRELRRQVRANPAVVLRRGFIHKAQDNELEIPAVVRLTPPGAVPADTLEVTGDTSVHPWPQVQQPSPVSQPPPAQVTTLDGSFGMQLAFGGVADGYGVLGAVETTQGQFAAMSATPFDISEFAPSCSTMDNPCTGTVQPCATQPELRATSVVLNSAGTGHGLLELFGGRFRGTLYLRAMVATQRQSTCGSGLVATAGTTNDAARLPVSVDGDFRINPALTADGFMRLGVIRVVDPDAQRSNFALLHACTGFSLCDERSYPLRLRVQSFTAEVLIGSGAAPPVGP